MASGAGRWAKRCSISMSAISMALLREMGVGDLAVGKRMKALGNIFYGRATAYAAAFESEDPTALEALIARTILVERPGVESERT